MTIWKTLMIESKKDYIFTMTCPDTVCISSSVSNFIAENDGFITSSAHFGDPDTSKFFMRTVFNSVGPKLNSIEEFKKKFEPIALKYDMDWAISEKQYRPRVVIAVSKFGHCLLDLLNKVKIGQLEMDIVAVISNHTKMEDIVKWYGIDYHHLPVTKETKMQQEEQVKNLINKLDVDLVVLARYMQILSPDLCDFLKGRCINIHHSFLPSFIGAMPYHRAHDRGVKLIGATAHYVTQDLDQGPIVEQSVERVDHTFNIEDLIATGRDIESVVLSKAVKYHIERRVLLNNNKTVIFRKL